MERKLEKYRYNRGSDFGNEWNAWQVLNTEKSGKSIMSELANYMEFVGRIDARCREIGNTYGKYIVCKKGCADCCRHISIFPVEAAAIAAGMARLPAEQASRFAEKARESSPDGPCPLLDNGICLLYDSRPIICRTHGLPVLTVRKGTPEIDFCPMNFKDVATVSGDAVIDLDLLNNTLAAINTVFVKASGRFKERLRIADVVLGGRAGLRPSQFGHRV